MRAAERPVEVVVLPDRRHMTALSLMADPGDPTLALVAAFVERVTGRRR